MRTCGRPWLRILSDLKADSTQLQSISIRLLDFSQDSNLIHFYEVWKSTEIWAATRFEPTMVSLNQLQSTGVLSSTKQTIAAKVASYRVTLEVLRSGGENYYNRVEETFRMFYEMTDYIKNQTHSIRRILDVDNPCPADSIEYHFGQLRNTFLHLKRNKELQRGAFRKGLSKIRNLLVLFEERAQEK